MKCIAWIDEGLGAAENMAFDHQMLEAAAELDAVLMRVYEWKEPTQSLGYFQKFEQRAEHDESSDLVTVRRSTGGGAIVHHHDWTYSIAVPPAARIGGQTMSSTGASQDLYDCVHDAVIQWLEQTGRIAARKWNSEESCSTSGCAFLCFERRAVGDVVMDNSKIMGSAQRRHRGSLLQHGSLLLGRSQFAPSLLGLRELSTSFDDSESTSDNKVAFSEAVFTAVSELFGLPLDRVSNGCQLVTEFPAGNYAENAWTKKR